MRPAYTVIWKRTVVERDLASIVLREMQQGRPVLPITRAMKEIDQKLAAAPESEGESRDGMQRILIELPLAVTYEIHVDDRIVLIRSVRHIPPTSAFTRRRVAAHWQDSDFISAIDAIQRTW